MSTVHQAHYSNTIAPFSALRMILPLKRSSLRMSTAGRISMNTSIPNRSSLSKNCSRSFVDVNKPTSGFSFTLSLRPSSPIDRIYPRVFFKRRSRSMFPLATKLRSVQVQQRKVIDLFPLSSDKMHSRTARSFSARSSDLIGERCDQLGFRSNEKVPSIIDIVRR